jgi:hypothetical protein
MICACHSRDHALQELNNTHPRGAGWEPTRDIHKLVQERDNLTGGEPIIEFAYCKKVEIRGHRQS